MCGSLPDYSSLGGSPKGEDLQRTVGHSSQESGPDSAPVPLAEDKEGLLLGSRGTTPNFAPSSLQSDPGPWSTSSTCQSYECLSVWESLTQRSPYKFSVSLKSPSDFETLPSRSYSSPEGLRSRLPTLSPSVVRLTASDSRARVVSHVTSLRQPSPTGSRVPSGPGLRHRSHTHP